METLGASSDVGPWPVSRQRRSTADLRLEPGKKAEGYRAPALGAEKCGGNFFQKAFNVSCYLDYHCHYDNDNDDNDDHNSNYSNDSNNSNNSNDSNNSN